MSAPFGYRFRRLAVAFAFTLVVVQAQPTVWTGAVSAAWNNPLNWTLGVPGTTVDATVPAGTPNSPDTTGTAAVCRNLVTNFGSIVNVPPGSPLTAHGNIDHNGNLPLNGLVRVAGSGAHTVDIGGAPGFYDLELATTGTVDLQSILVQNALTQVSGQCRINGGIDVGGPTSFLGGTLAEGTSGGSSIPRCDLHGNVVFSGCTVTGKHLWFTYADWTSDAGINVDVPSALVFEGTGTQNVSAPGSLFHHVGVDVNATVNIPGSPLLIEGAIVNVGAFSAASTLRFVGSNPVIPAQTNSLPNVEIAPIGQCRVLGNVNVDGTLTFSTGTFIIEAFAELTIDGNATMSGGNIFGVDPLESHVGFFGDVVFSGTIVGLSPPVFGAFGTWTSDANFQPQDSGVAFLGQGPGVQTVNLSGGFFRYFGVLAGTTVDLATGPLDVYGFLDADGDFTPTSVVRFTGTNMPLTHDGPGFPIGVMVGSGTLQDDVTFFGSLTIDAGGSITSPNDKLTVLGSTLQIDGSLSLGAGAELSLGPTTAANVSTTGSLTIAGTTPLPVRVTGAGGGGYGFTIDGAVSAHHFLFRDMGAAGIRINPSATIAAIPNDFRVGTFDFPSAAGGAAMFDVQRAATTTFSYLRFEDTPGTGASNVRSTAGAAIVMRNWGGAAGGPAREIDPLNHIQWLTDTTQVFFQAIAGRERNTIRWTTSAEVEMDFFILENGPSSNGPWSQMGSNIPAVGPSTYQVIEQPLPGNVTVFYRLTEHLVHDELRVLGVQSACPWSAALPASILTVGSGGAFADIQAALNTVTNGDHKVISVATGTYPAFTINHLTGINLHLRILADGTGPVTISTATAPVLVQNLIIFDRIEISGLTIGSAGSPNPGLVIQNATPSCLILDQNIIIGGSGQPGVDVQDSQRLAFQRTDCSGTPGLHSDGVSMFVFSKGSLTGLDIQGQTYVRVCDTQSTTLPTVGPNAVIDFFPGVMPDIDAPTFQPLDTPFTLTISAEPNRAWFLGLSTIIDWYESPVSPPSPINYSMVGLFQIIGPQQLITQGMTDNSGSSVVPLSIPPDKILLGGGIPLQIVTFDGVNARWSNLISMIPMP